MSEHPEAAAPGTPGSAPAVDRDAFRTAMGRFATGVTVVTGRGQHPQAMTANAVASVSLDPPLLLVCIEQDARVHDAVLADGRFGVSVLAADQVGVSDWLASRGRPSIGQLDRVATATGPVLGVPLLQGGLATFECRLQAAHPAGDHTIVVGAVVGVTVDDRRQDPLLWFASGYRRLGDGSS